jgi:hypothetical protein
VRHHLSLSSIATCVAETAMFQETTRPTSSCPTKSYQKGVKLTKIDYVVQNNEGKKKTSLHIEYTAILAHHK